LKKELEDEFKGIRKLEKIIWIIKFPIKIISSYHWKY
jgi:hypothetical protein